MSRPISRRTGRSDDVLKGGEVGAVAAVDRVDLGFGFGLRGDLFAGRAGGGGGGVDALDPVFDVFHVDGVAGHEGEIEVDDFW